VQCGNSAPSIITGNSFVLVVQTTDNAHYVRGKFLRSPVSLQVKKQLVPLNLTSNPPSSLTPAIFTVLPLLTTTTIVRMSSPRSNSPAPSSPRADDHCTENGKDQSISPALQNNLLPPASSDASGSSSSGSYSRAPTPQCLPLDDQSPGMVGFP
jgi:hypothetical protein